MVKLIVGVLLAISARAEKPGPTPARFNAPAPSSKTQPTPSPGLRALRRSEWTKYTALSINGKKKRGNSTLIAHIACYYTRAIFCESLCTTAERFHAPALAYIK